MLCHEKTNPPFNHPTPSSRSPIAPPHPNQPTPPNNPNPGTCFHTQAGPPCSIPHPSPAPFRAPPRRPPPLDPSSQPQNQPCLSTTPWEQELGLAGFGASKDVGDHLSCKPLAYSMLASFSFIRHGFCIDLEVDLMGDIDVLDAGLVFAALFSCNDPIVLILGYLFSLMFDSC